MYLQRALLLVTGGAAGDAVGGSSWSAFRPRADMIYGQVFSGPAIDTPEAISLEDASSPLPPCIAGAESDKVVEKTSGSFHWERSLLSGLSISTLAGTVLPGRLGSKAPFLGVRHIRAAFAVDAPTPSFSVELCPVLAVSCSLIASALCCVLLSAGFWVGPVVPCGLAGVSCSARCH